jgi:branched-chain amino acid aminotransferase
MKSSLNSQPPFIIEKLPENRLKSLPSPKEPIPFGRMQTDHMLVCDFDAQKNNWDTPKILPFAPFSISPDSVVLHYGQQIFEGMKVYRDTSNPSLAHLFRPQLNAKRFANSALRLGMEPVPEDLFLSCIEELVKQESRWILPSPGSLYVRPALIPLDLGVSYRASNNYRFFVIVSPAMEYYANPNGVSVSIERRDVRAAIGGVGEAKCGGNYAAALAALKRAQSDGSEQVLWLDSVEKKYVEEVGAMNIFFVYENHVETPQLSGSILPGVTRRSLIELIPKFTNLSVVEKRVDIDEVLQNANSGSLKEVFGCGTAAVVSCISEFKDKGKKIKVGDGKAGQVSLLLKKTLTDIQNGTSADEHKWRHTFEIGDQSSAT